MATEISKYVYLGSNKHEGMYIEIARDIKLLLENRFPKFLYNSYNHTYGILSFWNFINSL